MQFPSQGFPLKLAVKANSNEDIYHMQEPPSENAFYILNRKKESGDTNMFNIIAKSFI